jgi:sugar phosphate isomerase/epimerase
VPHRSAHDLGPDDVVLSHFTLDRHHPFEDRLAAAATAGCAGIGLFVGDYLRLVDEGHRPAELRAMVDDHALCIAEIEVARGWADPDPSQRESLEMALWEMADVFEPRYLQAIGPYAGSHDEAGRGFGRLCDAAADHGLLVGIEFLPFTNIATAADALAIVEGAGRANGGLCFDIWHIARGATDATQLDAVPIELVYAVQMSDGALAPVALDEYKDDCVRNRVPPGEGEMDAVGLTRRLLDRGVTAPWSLEVCDDAVRDEPATPHVVRCADAMRAVLAAAGERGDRDA